MPIRCVVIHKDRVMTHLRHKNEKLALKWEGIFRLKRADLSNGTAGTSTVCSPHLTPEDFNGYNQWKAGFRMRLKPGTVPSMNIGRQPLFPTSLPVTLHRKCP